MGSDITYETIWQITQREKQTNELQLLPKTVYGDIQSLLTSLNTKEPTEEEVSIRKNVMKLIGELYERRKQKILIYVAYKKQLPQPAIQREVDFYNKALELANRNKFEVGTAQPEQRSDIQLLMSLQTIPEILLPSGKKAGPFEKGQVVEMANNEEDIKFLITNTICKKV